MPWTQDALDQYALEFPPNDTDSTGDPFEDAAAGYESEVDAWLRRYETSQGNQAPLDIPPNSGLDLWEAPPFSSRDTTGQPGTFGMPGYSGPGAELLGLSSPAEDVYNPPASPFLGPGSTGRGTGTGYEYENPADEQRRINADRRAEAASQAQVDYLRTQKAALQQQMADRARDAAATGRPVSASQQAADALRMRALDAEIAATQDRSRLDRERLNQEMQLANMTQGFEREKLALDQTKFDYTQKKDRRASAQQFVSMLVTEMGRLPSMDLVRSFLEAADLVPVGGPTTAVSGNISQPTGLPAATEGLSALGGLAQPPATPAILGGGTPLAGFPTGMDRMTLWNKITSRTASPAEIEFYMSTYNSQPVGVTGGASLGRAPVAGTSFQAPLARSPVPALPAPTPRPLAPAAAAPVAPAPAWKPLTNADYVRNPITGQLQRR